MNLVKVATWIQEGYREAYDKEISNDLLTKWVVGYVMKKSKGHLNPLKVEDLVKLETSVPDKEGRVMCANGGGKCDVSDWINVSDRLPDDVGYSVDYLICLMNGDRLVAAWMNIGGWDFDPKSPITYWMPLPNPPN